MTARKPKPYLRLCLKVPSCWPRGYDSNAIREAAASKNAWTNILSRSNRKQRFPFSGWVYRQRNLIERFFKRIKHFRGIATRYYKCPDNYLAAVKLICAHIWCAA